jgi:pimeloyl-ACP methyl ester carboxylesterase
VTGYSQLKVKTDGTVKIGSFINGFNHTSDVYAFQLSVDGNTLSSGYWLLSDSDIQKKPIAIEGALGKLLKINGSAFTNSRGVKLNYGFNVQEIKNEFPHLVRAVENSSLFVINYDGFIPLMVEAMKEQQTRIQELEKEVGASLVQGQKDRKNNTPKDVHFTVIINLKFPDHVSSGSTVNDADSVYIDQAILKLPKTYSGSGTPIRLVYYAHGAGSNKEGMVTSNSWFPENNTLIDDSLLANGYAIFDVNGGPVVENMGGSWVVQSVYKAYEYIRQHYHVHNEIFVIGLSMGGLSSANFVNRHSQVVLAHGMFCPVLDLYGQAWVNPWYSTTKQSLARTYNFKDSSGNTWEPEKVKGWNPLYTNSFFNAADTFKIYPVPVKIWHAQKDETVNISGSRKFHRYIQNANGYSELRELQNGDHGLSKGNPVMIRELILFFRRFDK